MDKAMVLARKTIESSYKGTCTVVEYQETKDPVTKITRHEEVPVLENQPCKLSYQTLSPVRPSEAAYEAVQVIKLFITPEVEVKAGSKIVVTQNGIATAYERSGEPAVYPTHQEIVLKLFKGWT